MEETAKKLGVLFALQEECLQNLKKAEMNFKKTPKDRIKRTYLETRLESLEGLYVSFKEGHKAIITEALTNRAYPYFVDEKYESFEETYIHYKTLIMETLQPFITKSEPSSLSAAKPSPSVSVPASTKENGQCDVRLPRIILPTFSGKYDEWQTFYDMFSSLIHNNKLITPVEKLHYLKSNLSGEAQNLLRNFSTTDANYEEAWKQLVRRYDNKRYNCNAVLRNLFSLKKLQTESANAIKQLLDITSTCLKSLENIGISTSQWDAIIVFLVVSKLDSESIKQWEQHLNTVSTDELPTWEQLRNYLESRFRSLEMIDTNVMRPTQPAKPVTKPKMFHASIENKPRSNEAKCAMCRENHLIYQCKQYDLLPPIKRQEFVQNNNLCFNCLSPTHSVMKCRQPRSCRRCGRRHHTTLHFEREMKDTYPHQESTPVNVEVAATSSSEPHRDKPMTSRGDTHITTAFSRGESQPSRVLLATARVKVFNSNNCKQTIRALLDQGSQASFVTEATVQLLGLSRKPISGWVSGLGDGRLRIKHTVSLRLVSRHNPASVIQVNAYVLHSLTSLLPATKLSVPVWSDITDLPLADPDYTVPGKIDILLGAEVYSEILLDGMIKQAEGSLMAQNTAFGWIISGRVKQKLGEFAQVHFSSMHIHVEEENLLKKFWEMENEPDTLQKEMTKSEKLCEYLFDSTTVRDEEGRFVVRLPFATDDPNSKYGHSKEIAIKRLESLERKLSRDPKLREEYNKVFEEYLSLNHMRPVYEHELENKNSVYLPHHAVIRDDKETTKVRIVFNASSKGDNNVSLNDDLLVGPKLQQDLRHILMRWRNHKVCLIADIVKMYRMVRVAAEDTDYQRIVWRFKQDEPVQHFKLLRLTFGTACAPYLAVKSLQRLADLEEDKFPLAAQITKRDYYMDDLITGAETECEALKIYHEMNELMKLGGFTLQKWTSNCKNVLEKISDKSEQWSQPEPVKLNKTIKVLGMSWCRETDRFVYIVDLPEPKEPITKRQVLADVARLYDPEGWIAPVVVNAKKLIQSLWKSGLSWDHCLPEDILREWLSYRRSLVDLKQLKIPRWFNVTRNSKTELHVFSDASKSAFAAAVYIRVIDESNKVHVHLVTAKTKVAPLEKEVSIPRLELCGSALAAKLIWEVAQVMEIPKNRLFGWTDSTIVLAWLRGGACRWTTFVSNRVSTILNIMDVEQWNHVRTESNSADCASRGLQPKELINHPLWWNGPHWLSEREIEINDTIIEDTQVEEKVKSFVSSIEQEEFIGLKFSSLTRLLKVVAYCRRVLNLKLPKNERLVLPKFITVDEIKEALLTCVKQVQKHEFESEIRQLKTVGHVHKRSPLRSLCPFLDEKGILRVSGRIAHSDACYDTRHPIIMPAKHHFTKLLIIDAHHQTYHGGPQMMINFLRTKFWIIQAKERVKKIFRECVTCLRYSTKKTTPLMGLLPQSRLKPNKPFKSTGVDYFGPIQVRFSPGRGAKSYKGYGCLFVCMVTRAIHLEVVTDMTAKAFIAAFRRFTARRGHCEELWSDNGTNFVGADREMKDMFNSAKSALPEEIAELLVLERTTWRFIPPHSPNFGGLWEAGVRSTKTHLRKILGNTTLTYEELATVLAQVEACLNSRPISLISDDPNDPLPLTPGHFLIGEPLINIVDQDNDCNVHSVDRWRLVQKIVNNFWSRWYREYLGSLNQRFKWNTKGVEPEIGNIVIIKEDNMPPAKWLLGKIIQKHTGPDNITRVVTVKCKSGLLKRPALENQKAVEKHLSAVINNVSALVCAKCGYIGSIACDYVSHMETCDGVPDQVFIEIANTTDKQADQTKNSTPRLARSVKIEWDHGTPTMESGPVTCAVCKKSMENSCWIEHIKQEHDYLAWVEGTPALDLENEDDVRDHLRTISKDQNGLVCKNCGIVKKYPNVYLKHVRYCKGEDRDSGAMYQLYIAESDELVKCGVCSKEVTSPGWIKHIQMAHNYLAWKEGEDPVNLDDEDAVKKHLCGVLRNVSHLVCAKCGFTRRIASYYMVHMDTCDGVPAQVVEDKTTLLINGFYECAMCHEKIEPKNWKEHAMNEHYNITWIVGDIPIDLKSPYGADKYLKQYKLHTKKLQCKNCGETRASLQGFYAHIITCGKTEEEMVIYKEDCTICGKRYLGISRSQHMMTHREEQLAKTRAAEMIAMEDEKEDCLGLSNRRKAAQKANSVIEKYQKSDTKIEYAFKCDRCSFGTDRITAYQRHKCDVDAEAGSEESEDDDDFNDSDENISDLVEDEDEDEGEAEDDDDVKESDGRDRSKKGGKDTPKLSWLPFKLMKWKPYYDQMLASFRNEYLSEDRVFSEWLTSQFSFVPEDEVADYTPKIEQSCRVCVNGTWQEYDKFEGTRTNHVHSMFVGGTVQHSCWAPCVPRDIERNFLAVAAHLTGDPPRHNYDETPAHPALIQLWDFGAFDQNPPKLALGIAHDYGSVWDMDWCPSGARQLFFEEENKGWTRLGLLAIACSNGSAYILSVPYPKSIAESDKLFVKLKPVAELRFCSKDSTRRKYQATAISWSKNKGHGDIVVAYSDGSIARYDLINSSPLLKGTEDEVAIFYPYHEDRTLNTCVTGVDSFPGAGNAPDPVCGASPTGAVLAGGAPRPVRVTSHQPTSDAIFTPAWPAAMVAADEGQAHHTANELEWHGCGRKLGVLCAAAACLRCGRVLAFTPPYLRQARHFPPCSELSRKAIASINIVPLKSENKQGKKIIDELSVKVEPFTYEDAVKKYGINFKLLKQCRPSAAVKDPFPEQFPLADVTSIAFCTSERHHERAAVALHSGHIFMVRSK